MKTIEQAATEVISSIVSKQILDDYGIDVFVKVFKCGVEFAQQWISVVDELPHNKECAKLVLVKLLCEPKKATRASTPPNTEPFTVFSMGVYNHYFNNWSIIHQLIESKFHCEKWEVTHWRPIELK